jgi:hypothetical protein
MYWVIRPQGAVTLADAVLVELNKEQKAELLHFAALSSTELIQTVLGLNLGLHGTKFLFGLSNHNYKIIYTIFLNDSLKYVRLFVNLLLGHKLVAFPSFYMLVQFLSSVPSSVIQHT